MSPMSLAPVPKATLLPGFSVSPMSLAPVPKATLLQRGVVVLGPPVPKALLAARSTSGPPRELLAAQSKWGTPPRRRSRSPRRRSRSAPGTPREDASFSCSVAVTAGTSCGWRRAGTSSTSWSSRGDVQEPPSAQAGPPLGWKPKRATSKGSCPFGSGPFWYPAEGGSTGRALG